MDTKKLALAARAALADGSAPNLEAAASRVVREQLAAVGGSTPRQERQWVDDVLRVARAAEADARTLNGGVRPGAGRVGDVAAAAERLAQMTARAANLDAMSAEQLRAAVTSVERATRALEAEVTRRRPLD